MEGRLREKGLDGMGRGWQGGGVFAEASNQISLMKWVRYTQPNGPEATDILSYAS